MAKPKADASELDRVLSVLGEQLLLDVLKPIEARVFSRKPKARSKVEARELLRGAPGGIGQIVAAISVVEREDETPSPPYVFQRGTLILGLLGLRSSRMSRKRIDAEELMDFLADLEDPDDVPPNHLERVVAELASSSADIGSDLARVAGLRGRQKLAGLVQLALMATDDELVAAINATGRSGVVFPVEGAQIEDGPFAGFSRTRYGLVRLPPTWPVSAADAPTWLGVDDPDARARLGLLISEQRHPALSKEVSRFHSDPRRGAALMVVELGPLRTLSMWLSDADVWQILSDLGLRLPDLGTASGEELRELLLGLLGFECAPRPQGWYSLAKDLREPSRNSGESALQLCKHVEQTYAWTVASYLWLLLDEAEREDTELHQLLGRRGVDASKDLKLGSRGKPIHRMTFGEKISMMKEIQGSRLLSQRLGARLDAGLLTALVGDKVDRVRALRNEFVHGKDIPLEDVRAAVADWLTEAGAYGSRKGFPLPIRVRAKQTVTDEYLCRTSWGEDELGAEFPIGNHDLVGIYAAIGDPTDILEPPIFARV